MFAHSMREVVVLLPRGIGSSCFSLDNVALTLRQENRPIENV